MLARVEDLLDVARTRLGQSLPIAPAPQDLGDACRQAVDETRARYPDRELRLDTGGDLHGVWDGARLQQMLVNLVQNAVQHGRPGTPVRLPNVRSRARRRPGPMPGIPSSSLVRSRFARRVRWNVTANRCASSRIR